LAVGNPWTASGKKGFRCLWRKTGALLITADESTSPKITSEGGWDVNSLMRWLGVPIEVDSAHPLLLNGLPPGTYRITPITPILRLDIRSVLSILFT
jgi:hypothetical protein